MLRIENNKGFFEGAAMAERKGERDEARQLAEAEYAKQLQQQMAMQRLYANNIADAGERAKAVDDINMRERSLRTQGSSKDLWLVQDDGTLRPANVFKPKATRQANLQREYNSMIRPDGTLKSRFEWTGTAYDQNLGTFMQTNPNMNGVETYTTGGKRVWNPINQQSLINAIKP